MVLRRGRCCSVGQANNSRPTFHLFVQVRYFAVLVLEILSVPAFLKGKWALSMVLHVTCQGFWVSVALLECVLLGKLT